MSSSKTQQVIPGERRQGRSARALTPENQSIVTWRESRATAGPASPPLLGGRCSQSKGLWAGVPGDSRLREAGARSGGGGVGAPREEGSCGQPRPMRRLFSKGVARSGLAVSPSAPDLGREEGWRTPRSGERRLRLPSALAALEPRWAPAPASTAPAGSPGSVSGRRACSVRDTTGHWALCGIRRVARGTVIPALELCRLRSDSGALERPAAATGPGALPEPGRRVSSARRTASSRAEEPPPAGMLLPASAGSRRPGASCCPSFGRSHGSNAGGSTQLFAALDFLGQKQGIHRLGEQKGEWPWRSGSVLMPLRA